MAHHPAAQPLDNVDPHHELHAEHVIVRPSTLVAVLTVLLTFTVLTIACSRAEVWAADAFHIKIPHLINVVVALSIALVKSVLVALFFMQLKYDNPLNAIVFLFCLFAFVLFLFFSMTDLGTRAAIYQFKSGEIQTGGLGIDTAVKEKDANGNEVLLRGVNTGNKGIVQWARDRRIEEIGNLYAQGKIDLGGRTPQERYWEEFEVFHHLPPQPPPVSDANRSVPVKPGPTPGLFAPAAPATHGGEHGH
jgi:caa(3)-type oxidase subunit IV